MRLRSYTNGGYGFRGIDPAGGVMVLPLKLVSTPTDPMEAVTRQYVDEAVTGIDASGITGQFAAARLPSWTGGDINATGGVFTLTDTGVTPGSYAKVIVDNKGRVTGSGGALTAADIPNLSWNKVVDRPTTLSGYGITDVVSLNGGTMTGALSVTPAPTQDSHLANKEYVDTKIGGNVTTPFNTGDIVFKSGTTTPAGYLRCNGAQVSKTAYSALYDVISSPYAQYAIFDYNGYAAVGAGRPWQQQYNFNHEQRGDIGA